MKKTLWTLLFSLPAFAGISHLSPAFTCPQQLSECQYFIGIDLSLRRDSKGATGVPGCIVWKKLSISSQTYLILSFGEHSGETMAFYGSVGVNRLVSLDLEAVSQAETRFQGKVAAAVDRIVKHWEKPWEMRLSGVMVDLALRTAKAKGIKTLDQIQARQGEVAETLNALPQLAITEMQTVINDFRADNLNIPLEALDALSTEAKGALSISVLALPNRPMESLLQMGITTVDDLARLDAGRLKNVRYGGDEFPGWVAGRLQLLGYASPAPAEAEPEVSPAVLAFGSLDRILMGRLRRLGVVTPADFAAIDRQKAYYILALDRGLLTDIEAAAETFPQSDRPAFMRETPTADQWKQESILWLRLQGQIDHDLLAAGIITIGDLTKLTEAKAEAISTFIKGKILTIKKALEAKGLSFAVSEAVGD
ncbi:hypothetical protein K2X33_11635 [bacterium]|nr:hypothetical protein [bacterium]